MNKITLGIEEIIKAQQVLNKVLTLQGIPRNKNYWFDRNKKWLEPHVKRWFGVDQKVIVDKYIVETPATPFVPPNKYEEFKKELYQIMEAEHTKDIGEARLMLDNGLFLELLTKYETKSNASKGIPMENRAAFEKEVNEVAAGCEKEVEFQDILVDQSLDQILKSLSGDEQLSISYMLKDMSPLEIFPREIQ